MRTADILFTGGACRSSNLRSEKADDTHKPFVVKARRSLAPFHRPKYFNHKIILASIEPRSDASARDKIALPKGQAGSASPFCTGEFSLRARTRRRKLFPRGANLAY
jgi:hypothetical protein